ncbi:hypothetical protein BJY59DRAFT_702406 [Rhodotorula toruloides]
MASLSSRTRWKRMNATLRWMNVGFERDAAEKREAWLEFGSCSALNRSYKLPGTATLSLMVLLRGGLPTLSAGTCGNAALLSFLQRDVEGLQAFAVTAIPRHLVSRRSSLAALTLLSARTVLRIVQSFAGLVWHRLTPSEPSQHRFPRDFNLPSSDSPRLPSLRTRLVAREVL